MNAKWHTNRFRDVDGGRCCLFPLLLLHVEAVKESLGATPCRNIRRDRKKLVSTTWLESIRPTSLHLAQYAVLQRRISIYLLDGKLKIVDIAVLQQMSNVVRQIAWHVTNCGFGKFSTYGHGIRVRLVSDFGN